MKTNHTKGLFTEVPFHNGTHIFSDTGKKLASFWYSLFSEKEHEANVKLMIAAPDLLEFAEEMVRRYPNSQWIYEQGNKAIKKATE